MRENRMVICICIIALFIGAIIALDCGEIIRQTQTGYAEDLLLIDPGHGGMDGGAVSSDGTMEKNINLSIAKELQEMAGEYGWQVVMTRESDQWLCSSEEGSIRSRKTADLRARCEMINKYRPQAAVSIHLNSFREDPSVKGAQVFYPDPAEVDSSADDEVELSGQCRQLAEVIQTSLNNTLEAGKERTAMVRKDVFLFKEVVCPVIIVECGFLSNPEEAQLLQSAEYQRKVASAIITGLAEFTGREKPENVEIIDSLR